jgi:hypothetical protein
MIPINYNKILTFDTSNRNVKEDRDGKQLFQGATRQTKLSSVLSIINFNNHFHFL